MALTPRSQKSLASLPEVRSQKQQDRIMGRAGPSERPARERRAFASDFLLLASCPPPSRNSRAPRNGAIR